MCGAVLTVLRALCVQVVPCTRPTPLLPLSLLYIPPLLGPLLRLWSPTSPELLSRSESLLLLLLLLPAAVPTSPRLSEHALAATRRGLVRVLPGLPVACKSPACRPAARPPGLGTHSPSESLPLLPPRPRFGV